MKVTPQSIPDLLLIEPDVFGDARGFFVETWNAQRYADAGIPYGFVQDNLSFSRQGIVRGLHAQNPNPQGKLIQVLQGSIFDVAVDIRRGSPTFGQWHGVELSADNAHQFWIPPGFVHGFAVLSETALVSYKCTDLYSPTDEFTVQWNDPRIGIKWPVEEPILSAKDQKGVPLADIAEDKLTFAAITA